MIDALFGSKTRVKLLHLFLNNPGQSFFVREITRKIDEQINSVRRELSNMLEVGIITSDSSDNKLYYQVNQRYDYYVPLRAIFSDGNNDTKAITAKGVGSSVEKYGPEVRNISGLRLAVFAGVLVKGSNTVVDVLLVGNISPVKMKALIANMEKSEGREINYSVLPYDDFYYRLSVRDRFITEIINGKHEVIVDVDNIINK
ncbi:MAG TPA: transcriptional regulator [Candidatus Saccharimonadales bacterium]|nr:transcriptional regulator [Candidatus Saccharimonadales bacterium]